MISGKECGSVNMSLLSQPQIHRGRPTGALRENEQLQKEWREKKWVNTGLFLLSINPRAREVPLNRLILLFVTTQLCIMRSRKRVHVSYSK